MSRFKSLMISATIVTINSLNSVLPVSAFAYDPVGGVVTAVNKLAIVAPYLVLAGIVAVASVIYIKRRRHN